MKVLFAFVWLILALAAQAETPVPKSHFERWRDDFAARAIEKGFDPALVHNTLAGLTPDPAVLERDGAQPEFTRSMAGYLAGVLSPARIQQGREAMAGHGTVLVQIEERYHVPAALLSAIWGLESAYGKIQGDFDIVRSLATLADDGRRRAWAEGELLAVLRLLDRGDADRSDLKGAWAGAMGQPQFLPSAYLRFAVDWDGDGRKDIWHDPADGLASMAYFLAAHDWQGGAPWGVEVQLPNGFAYELAEDTELSIGAWSVRGVVRADHAIWSARTQNRLARLILPAGHRGPAFLVSDNFDVIRRYNNSTAYALGVGLLADRLGSGEALRQSWPEASKPLSRSRIKALQAALNRAGYAAGQPDGLAGPNTRRALRAFQKQNGFVPDGFIDQAAYAQIAPRLADLGNAAIEKRQQAD